ncbi:MAG: glycosyltransferase family 4 protein [Flavihumibacter sp.]|nr:glycosyltransferase family 4 protein [Flavihumibacter sp.]
MRLSYITTYDAFDVNNWSGLGYYISKALTDQGNTMNYIGNLDRNLAASTLLNAFYYRKLLKKGYPLDRDLAVVKAYANQIRERIGSDTDLLFSPGSIPMALLEHTKPRAFYTDSTFAGILGFYKDFSNLSAKSIQDGNYLEQKALDTASLAIYSSEWAASSAIKDYNTDPAKVKVVPFGANLEGAPVYAEIRSIIRKRPETECNLLFLGVDWERKGGNLALEIAADLNKRGLKTTLHIVGIDKYPSEAQPPYVRLHGRISKNSEAGNKKIRELLENSHFLILPTMADCTPIVFSEANSFGLPCISTTVGGIPTIIKNGQNGQLFTLTDAPGRYADYIESLFANNSQYEELCLASYHEFESRLNWNTAGKTITQFLRQL